MSYTIHVFSPQETPLLKEQLRDEMKRRGFEIVFCQYLYKGFAVEEGPINADFEILVACEFKSEVIEKFRQVVQARDLEALRAIVNECIVFTCLVSTQIHYDISHDWDEEEIEELEESDPEEVRGLRQARSEYTVQANIHFGGIEFATIVWRAIGELVGGMLEDPQEGTIEFVTARGENKKI